MFIALLGLLVGAIGLPLMLIGLWLHRRRERRDLPDWPPPPRPISKFVAVGFLFTFIGCPGSLAVGCGPILFPQVFLPLVAQRGDSIVDALRRFEADQGHPPATLDDLTPIYLSELPGTGSPVAHAWEYRLHEGSWWLCAPIDGMMLDFDEYAYMPFREPTAGYRSWVRCGAWLYLDE